MGKVTKISGVELSEDAMRAAWIAFHEKVPMMGNSKTDHEAELLLRINRAIAAFLKVEAGKSGSAKSG